MTLTKVKIAENLIQKYGLTKQQAKDLVESFFEQIRTLLAQGEEVKLSGFGNFELREKSTRPGRNPKTGETVAVSARRVVVFRPRQKLRARVENAKLKG